MVLGLIVALLAGQAIVEWVDEEGQSHFTNIPSTIPKGVDRHEMTFEHAPARVVGPSDQKPFPSQAQASPDRCEAARQELDSLEARLEDQQVQAEAQEERQARECQEQLNLHGEGAWLACRSSIPDPEVSMPLLGSLENARETLRRAQLEGCR